MRSYVPVLARLFLGLIFLMSGINKITGFGGTEEYVASHGIPLPAVFLAGAIAIEIIGGLSVILGLWARVGAAALVLFLIPTTLIFHTDFGQQTQMVMFLKNLSIMGGLLLVMAYGSGTYRIQSFDVDRREEAAYA